MIKLLTIIGARPQFIKAAALSREISERINVEEIIVHTGQHYDSNMSDVFFNQLKIPRPDYSLNINNLSSEKMISKMIFKISEIIETVEPNYVLVYGDTNSTLAGAIAASYNRQKIKLIHVESGLRSYNYEMPEEKNRILTDNLSDILFCPTDLSMKNLQNEGFLKKKKYFYNSGDIMYDNLNHYTNENFISSEILKKYKIKDQSYIVTTIHRFENTTSFEKMKNIIDFLNLVNKENKVIFPIHPNTKNILKKYNLVPEFETIDPLNYFDMLSLIKYSRLIISDSGGIQKEAFYFKKKCFILREETEWVEIIKQNAGIVNNNIKSEDLFKNYNQLLSKKPNFDSNPYGNGQSSKYIIDVLESNFNGKV